MSFVDQFNLTPEQSSTFSKLMTKKKTLLQKMEISKTIKQESGPSFILKRLLDNVERYTKLIDESDIVLAKKIRDIRTEFEDNKKMLIDKLQQEEQKVEQEEAKRPKTLIVLQMEMKQLEAEIAKQNFPMISSTPVEVVKISVNVREMPIFDEEKNLADMRAKALAGDDIAATESDNSESPPRPCSAAPKAPKEYFNQLDSKKALAELTSIIAELPPPKFTGPKKNVKRCSSMIGSSITKYTPTVEE
jgi:hypothetical protein